MAPAARCYFRAVRTLVNRASTVEPSELTLATIASAMPAAINEYSMAVAPECPSQKRTKNAFMGRPPDLRVDYLPVFVNRPGYELVNPKGRFSCQIPPAGAPIGGLGQDFRTESGVRPPRPGEPGAQPMAPRPALQQAGGTRSGGGGFARSRASRIEDLGPDRVLDAPERLLGLDSPSLSGLHTLLGGG